MGKIRKNISAVVFDMDGTLIDSLEAYTRAMNRGLTSFNLGPISRETMARLLNSSISIDNILKQLYPVFLNDEINRKCKEIVVRTYFELEQRGVSLLPGVREVLIKLKGTGIKTGVLTGRTSVGEAKWIELKRLNIDQLIDAVVTAGESKRKPDPEGLLKCIDALSVKREEAIFVGDATADILTAKNAMVTTIAVLTGVGNRKEIEQLKPDFIINDLYELIELI